ncbi:MAG: hypothetical protein ABFD76_09000 [Smithella sp.]
MEKQLTEINKKLEEILTILQQKSLPLSEKADAPNPLGYKKCRNHKLIGGFRDPEIRDLVISLRKQGQDFTAIESAIKTKYPENKEKHISRSALHRFCESARKGRLREYGIDTNLNKFEG